MIFDTRIHKGVAQFIDYDRDFRKVSQSLGVHGNDDGTVGIRANAKEFMKISREQWDQIANDHKRSLISNNIYSWNNYAVYGFLEENNLVQKYLKFAVEAQSTN